MDATRAFVAGAQVSATNLQTGLHRTVVSNGSRSDANPAGMLVSDVQPNAGNN